MKRLLLLPLRFLDRVLDHVFVALFALLLAQGPGFYNAYVERLAGHTAEAEANLVGWQEQVADAGGFACLEDLRDAYLLESKAHLVATGKKLAADMMRAEALATSLAKLRQARAWQRPFLLVREADPAIVRSVVHDFVPSLPITTEALAYALAGLLLGFGVYVSAKKAACSCGHVLCRACRSRIGRLAVRADPLDQPCEPAHSDPNQGTSL